MGKQTAVDTIAAPNHRAGDVPHATGSLYSIPIDKIDPSSFQHRSEMDPEKLEELAGSIATSGLLQAIVLREVGDRFQIIAGHRRHAAYKLLLERAENDDHRHQYRTIKAEVKTGLDDEGAERLGLIENLQRDDPSALDAAGGLASYMTTYKLDPVGVADKFMMDVQRVRRLLRLHTAPAVIKAGVTKGIMVPLLDEDGSPVPTPQGRAKQEHRQLEMLAALEFIRLYKHYQEESPKKAVEKTESAITRALQQNWGLRRIHSHVVAACGGKEAKAEKPAKGTKPPWTETGTQIVIFKGRMGGLAPEAQEEILRRVRATFSVD